MSMQHAQPRWVPKLTYIEYFILQRILNKALAGIEIFEELVRETNGQLVLSPGTLYAALKRMLAEHLIEMIDGAPGEEIPANSRRKFYRATAQGRAQIEDMVAWMRREYVASTEELQRPDVHPPTSAPKTSAAEATPRIPEQEAKHPKAVANHERIFA